MTIAGILADVPQIVTTIEEIVKVVTAVQSGIPVAVEAFTEFKAVIAAGTL